MLNEMFLLLSYLRQCAFTANPKEITVNNFGSTFDNADHNSWMASALSDAKWIESNLLSVELPNSSIYWKICYFMWNCFNSSL